MNTGRHYQLWYFALAILLVVSGCSQSTSDRNHYSIDNKYASEIDRQTFSVSIPRGWTEDTADDMYDPETFVFFENPESCMFSVMIGEKSTGITIDDILLNQKAVWEEKLTNCDVMRLTKWATREAKGFEIKGKMFGMLRSVCRMYGFDNDTRVCVVMEFAVSSDFKKYAADFEKIRQTFRLK